MPGNLTNLLDGPIGGNSTSAAQAVSSATNRPAQNINGCQVISIQCVISAASSPSGASAKGQVSNDAGPSPTNCVDLTSPASQNITANGALMYKGGDFVNPGFKWVRLAFAISSGSFTATTSIVGKGTVN